MPLLRVRWLVVILAVVAVALGVVVTHPGRLGGRSGSPAAPGQPDPVTGGEVQTVLEPDAIRAIDNPRFVTAAQASWVPAETPVIGVAISGQAHAFPIAVLSQHEIVNDVLAGEPVAVTW